MKGSSEIERLRVKKMANNNILLIEPGYPNKYPPLGLMKIAQYHGVEGKRDNVKFIKGEDKSVIGLAWDRVYITTLFSFEYQRIAKSINFAIDAVKGETGKIFVGGIAASLMNDFFKNERNNQGWQGVRFIKGLLGEPPATSLELDPFDEELYSDDLDSTPIEDLTPDYSILDQIEYKYPVHDAYFTYASRGCIRKCKFCGVPTLEGMQRDTNSLTKIVNNVEKLYGPKKDLILMDNNVVASSNFKDIISEIVDLGFERGAKISRGRSTVQRRVDFNQGVDARILCKDPMFLKQLSRIAIKPLRIAFDHLGLMKPYAQAVRYSAENGLHDLSNYMLYNFHDSPEDLFQRMRLNVALNEELGIRIFSFPMRYQPVTRRDRGFIGEKWNSYFLRSLQLILQATHGIVSGNPEYFKHAFGDTYSEFEDLLFLPHHFIFNRSWYEQRDGKDEYLDFKNIFNKLSDSEKLELKEFLCRFKTNSFDDEFEVLPRGKIMNIAKFYKPLTLEEERIIWNKQRERRQKNKDNIQIPEDELVEDAGLYKTQ